MIINQKDVVLLNLPYSDYVRKKVRPAVIISNEEINGSEDCIILPITSVIKEDSYSIIIDQKDLSKGNLLKKSRIRIDKIMTIEKSQVIKKIGELDDKTFDEISKKLFNIL